MPFSPVSSGGGLTKLFDSTLAAPAAGIDSGAGGFSTGFDLLQGFIIARTAEAAVFSTLLIIFNNDSGAHYDYQLLRGRNATTTSPAVAADTKVGPVVAGANAAAGFATMIRFAIPGYAQTTFNKEGELVSSTANSAAAADDLTLFAFAWESTAAINRVGITVSGGSNLATGSRLLLYGT